MSSSFSDKSGRGILLAALNRITAEGIVFKKTDLDFAAPEVVDHNGLATRVVFTATAASPYEGSKEIFFNRADLQGLFTAAGIDTIEVLSASVPDTSTASVVAAVNARYSLGLQAEDFVTEQFEPGSTEVVITAAAGSHGYIGELIVNLVEGEIPLAEVVVTSELGDVVSPEPVPAYVAEIQLGSGDITLKGQNAQGHMIVGTGNPTSNLQVASNGEIEVAIGIRGTGDGPVNTAPVDGAVSLNLDPTENWTYSLSIALIEESVPVTDRYDVSVFIKSLDKATQFQLDVIRDDEGGLHLINPLDVSYDINDSGVADNGSVLQNIQKVSFIKTQLGLSDFNGAGAALGEFEVSIVAVRREGIVPNVVAAVAVSVTSVNA